MCRVEIFRPAPSATKCCGSPERFLKLVLREASVEVRSSQSSRCWGVNGRRVRCPVLAYILRFLSRAILKSEGRGGRTIQFTDRAGLLSQQAGLALASGR